MNFDLLPGEIIVDSFAGGGGASLAIEMALGRGPDIAINHDPEAIAVHTANHPHTRHFCESVWDVNPIEATWGRPVGLAWFSPDCKHFSKAKGGKPVSKKIRGLAWVVIRWAAKVAPRIIILENVEEFQTWGPLKGRRNKRPCPARKGQYFQLFVSHLQALGYQVEWKELKACDFGAPTSRKRLFIVARRDGQPIVWPKPSHGPGRAHPYRTAADCIDWSLPCPSIFGRKKPLAENTLRRIARGVKKYVLDAADPFIVRIGHTGRGDSGKIRGIDQPLGTVTTKAEHCLVSPQFIHLTHHGERRAHPGNEPLPTITGANGGELAFVAPVLAELGHADKPGKNRAPADLNQPAGTIMAGGGKYALVSAFLAKHYSGVVGQKLENPLGTVTTVDHHSLIFAQMEKKNESNRSGSQSNQPGGNSSQARWNDLEAEKPQHNAAEGSSSIGDKDKMRLSCSESLCREQAVCGICPSIGLDCSERANSGKNGHKSQRRESIKQFAVKSGIDDAGRQSSPCVQSSGEKAFALNTEASSVGRNISISEKTQRAGAFIFADRGAPGNLSDIRLQSRKNEVTAFLIKYFGTDGNPVLGEPLHTITTKHRFGLVTVSGQDYQIADIGLRMLSPKELFLCQGFPESYQFEIDFQGKRLSKAAQVRMCGNSVSPPCGAALILANVGAQEPMGPTLQEWEPGLVKSGEQMPLFDIARLLGAS